MKKCILLLPLVCVFYIANAQKNYVRNADFEARSGCPNRWNQIKYANYWSPIDSTGDPSVSASLPRGSAEYCNACADSNIYSGVPKSSSHYQKPRSGDGMIEAQMYFDEGYPSEAYKRDYVQGRLISPLLSGRTYCVTFYVSLSEYSGYAINHLGAYLDDGHIDSGMNSIKSAAVQINYSPQVLVDTVIKDTLNWVKVQGNFIAKGTENFITIGNFFDKANTSALDLTYSGDHFSWYLIDDVSVLDVTEVANAQVNGIVTLPKTTGIVSPGSDSVFIGTHELGMPCTWNILGNPTPISHLAGMKVHPDTTTTYVLTLDIKNHVTKDTVTVKVAPVGIPSTSKNKELVTMWPNPSKNELTVEKGAWCKLTIYNSIGLQVLTTTLQLDKQTIDISGLPNGGYVAEIINPATGLRTTKQLLITK